MVDVVPDPPHGRRRRGGAPHLQVDGAGEHHRRQRRTVLAEHPGQFARHPDAAHLPVLEVAPQPGLDLARQGLEGVSGIAFHRQQHHRGEVPQDVVDLRVQRQTVEQGHVDRQPPAAAPGGEHRRIRGQDDGRSAEPHFGGELLDAPPGRRLDGLHPVGEAVALQGRGVLDERQRRRRRQGRHALLPIAPGPGMLRGLTDVGQCQRIVAEGELQARQGGLGIAVERPPLRHQEEEAAPVEVDHRGAQMDAGAAPVEHRGAQLEPRPAVELERLVRHPPAGFGEPRLDLLGHQAAQVVHRDGARWYLLQDPLPALGQDDGAQHVVALDQPPPRRFEPREVEVLAVDLLVEVHGHVAELEVGRTADPIGLLDLGQREGLEAVLRRRDDAQGWRRVSGGDGSLRPAAVHLGGELPDGRPGEKGHRRHVDPDGVAQARQEPGGEDGVAAELEEVVGETHPADAEELAEQRRHQPLGGGFRLGGAGGAAESHQAAAVDHAARQARQGVEVAQLATGGPAVAVGDLRPPGAARSAVGRRIEADQALHRPRGSRRRAPPAAPARRRPARRGARRAPAAGSGSHTHRPAPGLSWHSRGSSRPRPTCSRRSRPPGPHASPAARGRRPPDSGWPPRRSPRPLRRKSC